MSSSLKMSRILKALVLFLCCFSVLDASYAECVDYIALDVNSVDADKFNVVCDANKCEIDILSHSDPSRHCIGAVLDGKSVIVPQFEQEYTARKVYTSRYDADDLKHLDGYKFVVTDGKVTLVEVWTQVFGNWARLAFVKVEGESQENGQVIHKYQKVQFAPVQFDICSGDFGHLNREVVDGTVVYSGRAFEKLGNIVCNDRVVLDDANGHVYKRWAKYSNNTWSIVNVPLIGEEYEHILLPIAPSVEQYRLNRYGKTLDIDKDPSFYHSIASKCNDDVTSGRECILYDGCSNVSFLIDAIVDGNANVLLFDANIKCLVVKLETFSTRRHLSVYGSFINSNRPGTWLFVDDGDGNGFVEAKLEPLLLDLDNVAATAQVAKIIDKKDKTSFELVLKPEYRLENVIATVKRGDYILVEPVEAPPEFQQVAVDVKLISRRVYIETVIDDVVDNDDDDDAGVALDILKIVTIVSEYAHGHPTTLMFELLDDGGVRPFKPRPIQLDLADVHHPQTHFHVLDVDVSVSSASLPLVGKRRLQGAKKIVVAKSIYKIGTISYHDNLVVPNQFNVHSSECIYNGRDLYVTNYMYSGALVHAHFKLQKIFKNANTNAILCRHFVEEYKESIVVNLAHAKDLTVHPDLVVVDKNSGTCTRTSTSGYTEIHAVDVFSTIIGDVLFGDQVLVSRDDDAAERRLYIQGNFPLETCIVHIRTCTAEGDCLVQSREAKIESSGIVFVPVKKIPVVVDLHQVAAANLPPQVHTVTFGNVSYYRIKDEYATTHKIGNVLYQNKLLVPVTETADARLLNFAITSRDGKDLTATFRIVDVEAEGDARHGIKYNLTVKHNGNKVASINLTPVPPNPIHLNVNVCGSRNPAVGLFHRNDMYMWNVPWTKAPDFALASIVYELHREVDDSSVDGEGDVVVQDTLIEPKVVQTGDENVHGAENQFLSRAVHVYKQDLFLTDDHGDNTFLVAIQAPIHASSADAVDLFKCTTQQDGQTIKVEKIKDDEAKFTHKSHPHNPSYYQH